MKGGAQTPLGRWGPTSWVLLLIKPSRCVKNLQRRKRAFQPTIHYRRLWSPKTYLPYSKNPLLWLHVKIHFTCYSCNRFQRSDKSQACPFSEMMQEPRKEDGSPQEFRTGDAEGVHRFMSCRKEHPIRPGGPGATWLFS